MRKFSITARPEGDSEIVGEEDDKGITLRLEPPARFTSRAPFGRFKSPPRKLNTYFTYLTVDFACIFAHKRYI